MEKQNSYSFLRKKLEKMFTEEGIDELADIDWIMVEVTGKQRSMLPFIEYSEEDIQKIMEIAKKRAEHIPLGYILGKSYFFGREFKTNSSVLIPRLDTEVLIEQIVKEIKEFQEKKQTRAKVLDIGTGSGAIAITIQKETGADVTAVDVSSKALAVAKENAKNLKADVLFLESDLFENVCGKKFDFIVSNPPYIESAVIESLSPEVRDNEPILALDGGEDGLEFYRKIVLQAPKHLNKNGKLYFEIGYNQAEAVKKLMQNDFKKLQVVRDYSDNDRVVLGEIKWLKD